MLRFGPHDGNQRFGRNFVRDMVATGTAITITFYRPDCTAVEMRRPFDALKLRRRPGASTALLAAEAS